jgi:hypothetical protein
VAIIASESGGKFKAILAKAPPPPIVSDFLRSAVVSTAGEGTIENWALKIGRLSFNQWRHGPSAHP